MAAQAPRVEGRLPLRPAHALAPSRTPTPAAASRSTATSRTTLPTNTGAPASRRSPRLHDGRLSRLPARALHPEDLRDSLFVRDDWQVSDRIPSTSACATTSSRPTPRRTTIVNFDPVGLRLIYAGVDGTTAVVRQGNPVGQPRAPPRRGLGHHREREERGEGRLREDATSPSPGLRRTCWASRCRTRSPRTTASRRTPRVHARPGPQLRTPSGPSCRSAEDDRGAERGEPARARPLILERDSSMQTWQVSSSGRSRTP